MHSQSCESYVPILHTMMKKFNNKFLCQLYCCCGAAFIMILPSYVCEMKQNLIDDLAKQH